MSGTGCTPDVLLGKSYRVDVAAKHTGTTTAVVVYTYYCFYRHFLRPFSSFRPRSVPCARTMILLRLFLSSFSLSLFVSEVHPRTRTHGFPFYQSTNTYTWYYAINNLTFTLLCCLTRYTLSSTSPATFRIVRYQVLLRVIGGSATAVCIIRTRYVHMNTILR